MSATIRSVEDELGADIATAVVGVTFQDSTAGGLWPGMERPLGQADIPSDLALFLWVISRPPPRRKIRGGSASGQLHTGVARLLGVGSTPGNHGPVYALVKLCAEYAQNALPTGYSDLTIAQGPVISPQRGANELPRVILDLAFEYSE